MATHTHTHTQHNIVPASVSPALMFISLNHSEYVSVRVRAARCVIYAIFDF